MFAVLFDTVKLKIVGRESIGLSTHYGVVSNFLKEMIM